MYPSQPASAQSSTASQHPPQPPTTGVDKGHSPVVVPSLPRKPVQCPKASISLSETTLEAGEVAATTAQSRTPPAPVTPNSASNKKVIYERPPNDSADSAASTTQVPPGITAVPGLPSRPKGSFVTQSTNQARSRTLVPIRNNTGSVGAYTRPQQASQTQEKPWSQTAGTSASAPLIRIGETLPAVDLNGHQEYPYAPPVAPYPPSYHTPSITPHAPVRRQPWVPPVERDFGPPPWQRPGYTAGGLKLSFTPNDVPLPATHERSWDTPRYPPHPPIPHPEHNQGDPPGHVPGHPPPAQYGPSGHRYPAHGYDPWAGQRDA